jgi:thiamine-phosphate pyrophosphorylase
MSMDYSVYLVTDRGLSGGRSTLDIVSRAVAGGVSCVQLREKNINTREFIEEAMAVRRVLKKSKVPLIINDRVDVAMAVGADGVHLGQGDMPCKMAREMLPGSMVIGISAESMRDAVYAERDGADYIGVSPIYQTPTKPDAAKPLGLEGLERIRKNVGLPLVGIGGLKAENAAEVIKRGADGVAVVSAIVSAKDPASATRSLAEIVRRARS